MRKYCRTFWLISLILSFFAGVGFNRALRYIPKLEPNARSLASRQLECFEQEVLFENKASSIKLSGTLTKPIGYSSLPAVLLICGGGPVNRENSYNGIGMMSLIANRLAQEGVAVLRYDKRGVGNSEGSFDNATLLDFADDACAGIEFLRGLNGIDGNAVGILGHSEGGLVAAIVASRLKNISFAVFLAVPGRTWEVSNQSWLIAQNKSQGLDSKSIAKILESQQALDELVKSGKSDEETVALARIAISGSVVVKDVDKEARMRLSPPHRFLLTYDPVECLREVRCPALVLHGEKDQWIRPEFELPIVKLALESNGNMDVTAQQLSGLNHMFQKCSTGSVEEIAFIDEVISPSVLSTIERWITTQALKKRQK